MPKPTDLPFTEAIDFIKQKIRIPTERWDDLWQGQHARGFMVAGASKDALLADLHKAVTRAIEDGTTLDQFRQDFDQTVGAHGWDYNGGRNWRTRVIFETNVDQAYMAGKWKQFQESKASHPYARYVHADKVKDPRPEHEAWHGTILRKDDPWWSTHLPKNGWGCKCDAMELSDEDLEEYGFKVSEEAPTPPGDTTGIDPGFAYNVGEADSGRILSQAAYDEAMAAGKGWRPLTDGVYGEQAAERLPPARPTAVIPATEPPSLAAAVQSLEAALGGAAGTLRGPVNDPVYVHAEHLLGHTAKDAARRRWVALLPELIADPDEVWVQFLQSEATGKVALRRTYVRRVADHDGKERDLVFVASAQGGVMVDWTFFPTDARGSKAQRQGYRIYPR